jgi:uncharacterized protein YggE
MRFFLAAVCAATACTMAVIAPAPAAAQALGTLKPYDPAIVRVGGRAELYLPPDQARVSVSFYAPGRAAADATRAVSDRARALDLAIRLIDPAKVVIERTDIRVTPVMKEGGDRRPDQIRGFEGNADVTVLVKDLTLLTRTVEAAMNVNPDRFQDVAFSISDTRAARRLAREAAVADAVDKARTYVEGAGHRLGRLLLVEEGGSNIIAQTGNRAVYRATAGMIDADAAIAAPTIAPEAQLYTSEVTLIYEVGPALSAR